MKVVGRIESPVWSGDFSSLKLLVVVNELTSEYICRTTTVQELFS